MAKFSFANMSKDCNNLERSTINPLQPVVANLYPLKSSENLLGFFMFSGGMDKQHRTVMD